MRSLIFLFLLPLALSATNFTIDSTRYDAEHNRLFFYFNRSLQINGAVVHFEKIYLAGDDTTQVFQLFSRDFSINNLHRRVTINLNEQDEAAIESITPTQALRISVERGAFTAFYPTDPNDAVHFADNLPVLHTADPTPPVLSACYYDTGRKQVMLIFDEWVKRDGFNGNNGIAINGINLGATPINIDSEYRRIYLDLSYSVASQLDQLTDVTNIQIDFAAGVFANSDGVTNTQIQSGDSDSLQTGWGREFWIESKEKFSSGFRKKLFALRKTGAHADYYVSQQSWRSRFSAESLDTLQYYFETALPQSPLGDPYRSMGIYGMVRDIFGFENDVDGNERVLFLIDDILDDFEQGGRNDSNPDSYFPGYVTARDTSTISEYSNFGEYIYLDCYPQLFTGSTDLATGIQATAELFQKLVALHNDPEEAPWVVEGLSGLAQFFTGKPYTPFIRNISLQTRPGASLTNYHQDNQWHFRKDMQFLWFLYLFEQESGVSTIQAIAADPKAGMAGIQPHLNQDVKLRFDDFAVACLLDTLSHDQYGNRFGFANIELEQSYIIEYSSADFEQDSTITKRDIQGWSFNYFQIPGYDVSGQNTFNPGLAPDDSICVRTRYDGFINMNFIGLNRDQLDQVGGPFYYLASPVDSTWLQSLPLDFESGLVFRQDYRTVMLILTNYTPEKRTVEISDYPITAIGLPSYMHALRFSADKIRLSWGQPQVKTKSDQPRVTGTSSKSRDVIKNDPNFRYNIYRAFSNGGVFELIASNLDTLNYTDTGLVADSSYYYKWQTVSINPAGTSVLSRPQRVGPYAPRAVVKQTVSNFGRYGDPNADKTDRPSMEWPAGTRRNYLWEGRFWAGGKIHDEVRVSQTEFGNYEFYPDGNPNLVQDFVMGDSLFDLTVSFSDVNPDFHDTEPLNIKVIEHIRTWPLEQDSLLAQTYIHEYAIVNAGTDTISDFYVSWVWDCDVGTVIDVSDPHTDDLVDYDGRDGTATGSDTLDIVENYDADGNGKLDGYDEWGIPFGLQYFGGTDIPNPNYDPAEIAPDGYPDEYQLLPSGQGSFDIVSRNSAFMYDAENYSTSDNDTGERNEPWGPVDGFIGMRLLRSDAGLSGFQYWNWADAPGTDEERYRFMTGTHPSDRGYSFLPDPFSLGYPPFDYRMMLNSGSFARFFPGDTILVSFAATVGQGLQGMRRNLDYVYQVYDSLATIPTTVRGNKPSVPQHYSLAQNFPNPFNPETTLSFDLEKRAQIELSVIDILGRKIRTIRKGWMMPGHYRVRWEGRNDSGREAASGIYFFQLEIKKPQYLRIVRKGLLLK